jgi:two-component system chemotaxis response regulator CheV
MVLEQMGVIPIPMDSAPKAISFLEDRLASGNLADIGMIISDVEMPGMDGFTFTRTLKSNPLLAGLHVMLHTSMSNQSNKMRAEQVGADQFLSKFSPDDLVHRVSAVLEKQA